MLSETIALLTRRIAEEYDQLAKRLPEVPATAALARSAARRQKGSGPPADGSLAAGPAGEPTEARSLRRVLDWRRYQVN